MENQINEEILKAVELSDSGKNIQAIKILTTVLKKDKNNDRALFERSIAYLNLDKTNEAFDDLNNLIHINPDYPGARDWFARVCADNGDFVGAAEEKLKGLISNPQGRLGMGVSPNDWADCAMFFFNSGQIEKAIEVLEQYFIDFNKHVTLYKNYSTAPMRLHARILIEKGEYKKAYEWARKAYEDESRVPADISIFIKATALNGDIDLALTEYKKYINEIHGGFEEFKEAQDLKQEILNASQKK
jgi:tetratricopeptide (TPR) repeat protein